MKLIKAKYKENINIDVPKTQHSEEEQAVLAIIDWIKKSQYRGTWSNEESAEIYQVIKDYLYPIIKEQIFQFFYIICFILQNQKRKN